MVQKPLQNYLHKRHALREEERKHRHDCHFHDHFPSETVTKACQIVSRIREQELKSVWTAHGRVSTDEILSAGDSFNFAKGRVESTALWEIVRQMPKGSLLHAHLEAMFDVDQLITQCLATPGMHVSAEKPILTPRDFEETSFSFRYYSEKLEKKHPIWEFEYEPESLIPVQVAAMSFPGGKSAFRDWVKSRCVLSAEHTYTSHLGAAAIWAVFARIFPVVISMAFYEPIFRSGFRRLLRELADDQVRYVEFRVGSAIPFQRERRNTPDEDHLYFLHVFLEEIRAFQATAEGNTFYGARIIYSAPRKFSDEAIKERMERCIRAKQQFPELICGFDLVGYEELGRPLVDLVPVLLWLRQRCDEVGVNIPLFLHAGECLGDGDGADDNMFDAILLGSRRIGHAFSLYKHPVLIDQVKKNNILIECCPVSNEILRLTNSIKTHPLPALLARAVPVSLCNDDPAILGHGRNGLAHDFWVVLQGLDNMGLEGLATMAENSIRWSCYTDQTEAQWQADLQRDGVGKTLKADRLQDWYTDFSEFCKWIVDNFS